MGSLGKRLLDKTGGAALSRLQRSLAKKPPQKVEHIGERIGLLFHWFGKKRRERAISNLGLAFPELSLEERTRLARKVFIHFGRSSADFLASKGVTRESIESTTEIVGIENLDQALEGGKGVLLIAGHFGNFERIPAWVALAGYPMSVIIRNADQEGVNQVVNELRTGPGTRVIPRGNSAKTILERLRRNEVVGMIPDQNAEDAFIPFFDHPAGTNLGAGVIHGRTGAAVVPVYCAYLGPGKYQMVFGKQLEPLPGYETKGEGLLRSIHGWLEETIRQYPDQWLWIHDRWRNAREAGLL